MPELLEELARFTAVTLIDPATASCSITLMTRQTPVTAGSSAESAVRLDESQYQAGDGPCLTAIRYQVSIHVPDVGEEGRWPGYTAAARKEGIGSSLSVPLIFEGDTAAGLNLYSTRSHCFSSGDINMAEAFGQQASKALQLAVRIRQLAEEKTRLAAALEARTTIDMAAGIIMAQNRCDHATAMKIMKNAANSHNLGLRDIAASIITSINGGLPVRTHFDT